MFQEFQCSLNLLKIYFAIKGIHYFSSEDKKKTINIENVTVISERNLNRQKNRGRVVFPKMYFKAIYFHLNPRKKLSKMKNENIFQFFGFH